MTLDVRFQFNRIEHSMIVNHFRQYFDRRYKPVLRLIFCSNNSDGRIWAFYSIYLTLDTLDRDKSRIGLIHFVRKLLFLLKLTLFLSWPHI